MEIRKYIESYIQQSSKKRDRFDLAAKVSVDEVVARVENFSAQPTSKNLLKLLRGLTTSGVYISRSFLEFLISHIHIQGSDIPLLNSTEIEIIQRVYAKQSIDPHFASHREIFKAIFKNLLILHENNSFIQADHIEPFNSTLVLIPGVLNEIFSTAAFERGAKHLSSTLGIHYIVPKVYGTKSVSYNSKLLTDQLYDYTNDNPDEKLWLVAFSKGGVDALHFLAKNSLFAEKKVSGLSTISSPILGVDHLNHKLLKFINSLHKHSNSQIYKFFENQSDLLFKELQESLSRQEQTSWFSKNHKNLPSLPFYSALAMKSSWNESHLWMMLTKAFFQNKGINDGIVEAENALFPSYFDAFNLGIAKGHHLVGTRSSSYNQEALLEAHVLFLQYFNVLN